MPDLSTDELTRDGEHGRCETCGESFHWEQLTNTEDGAYCDEHVPSDDGADFGHDSAVDRGLGEGIER